MRHVFACMLWILVFLVLLIGIDQLLVRVPASAAPAPLAVVTFYRDLRARLIDLVKRETTAPVPVRPVKPAHPVPAKLGPAASVEGIIERHQASPATPPVPPSPPAPAGDPTPRYLYADDQGELHFAETLAEIPAQFRARSKVLGE